LLTEQQNPCRLDAIEEQAETITTVVILPYAGNLGHQFSRRPAETDLYQ